MNSFVQIQEKFIVSRSELYLLFNQTIEHFTLLLYTIGKLVLIAIAPI